MGDAMRATASTRLVLVSLLLACCGRDREATEGASGERRPPTGSVALTVDTKPPAPQLAGPLPGPADGPLAGPGAFVLAAPDPDPGAPKPAAPPAPHERGALSFVDAKTGRVLPLDMGSDIAAFFIDAAGKRLHALSFGRALEETDTRPGMLADLALHTLDLATAKRSTTRLHGQAVAVVVELEGGDPLAHLIAREEATAREAWVSTAVRRGTIEHRGIVPVPMTPVDLTDGASPPDRAAFCKRRYERIAPREPFVRLDRQCGDVRPAPGDCVVLVDGARLCRETGPSGAGEALVLVPRGGAKRLLLGATRIIQLGAL